MDKKEGATTDEERKQRPEAWRLQFGFADAGAKVVEAWRLQFDAIWNYFLVGSESRLSKELARPSLAWCLELASSRLKEGARTDDKRKQRSGSLKAAKLVSVRK